METGIRKAARLLALGLLLGLGGVAVAAPVPVEAFAAQQTFDKPAVSSNGSYLAVAADLGNDEHGIMVFRLADMGQTAFIKLPRYELANELYWVSDTRLIYVKGGKWGAREEPFDFGEIIAMDYDGKNHKYIYGYKESTVGMGLEAGHGNVEGLPLVPNGKFYMTRSNPESAIGRSLLYEVDASSGRHRLVADVGGEQNLSFVLDASGEPRFAHGRNKDDDQLLFVNEGGKWRRIPNASVGGVFVPLALTADGNQVYGTFSADDGPSYLVKADLGLGNRQVLAGDGFNDVGRVIWDSRRQPLAVELRGGKPKVVLLDPASPDARLYQEILAGFPGQHAVFAGHSADGSVSLIYIYSDRNPGEWAIMDRRKDTLARLLQHNPAIDPQQMGQQRYVRFKAGDGLELDGYLTVPPGVAEPRGLPMVLVPHGGPHFVSDSWGFDTDAQFLASRGYLVLQVNYRGSGGRGYGFMQAGYRQWGSRIQDDLADGIRWAVQQGFADPGRVCVYGASFGGYSAMLLAAREPELVRCAAGMAGLYDLRSLSSSKSDASRSYRAQAFLARAAGRDNEELVANSPVSMAARIRVPVFLAHGQADERTPFNQAEAMRKALQRAGNEPLWMAVPKEGHGFYAEKNVVAFYRQLEQFLGANLGSGK